MDKKVLLKRIFDIHVWSIAIIIIGVAAAIAQVTITTYYPAPYGEYDIMRANRTESGVYLDNPSVSAGSTGVDYWINIKGNTITNPSSLPSPEALVSAPLAASRLDTLGVRRLYDVDLPYPDITGTDAPHSTSWAPILDMNSTSKLQDLEVNNDLYVGRNGRVRGNLTVDGNIYVRGTTYTWYLKPFPNESGIHDISYFDQLHVHGTIRKHRCEAAIDTKDGKRALVAIESPEVKFFDEGKAKLQDGIVKIKIDEIFKQGIETDDYNVYLTSQDDCKGIWVAEKTQDYFIVKEMQSGKSNARFTWMISGVRKGCQGVRFEPYETTD